MARKSAISYTAIKLITTVHPVGAAVHRILVARNSAFGIQFDGTPYQIDNTTADSMYIDLGGLFVNELTIEGGAANATFLLIVGYE